METQERRNKRLGIRKRIKPLYPTELPKKGSYWMVWGGYDKPSFYFTTAKDLIDYLEFRGTQAVQYVRRP